MRFSGLAAVCSSPKVATRCFERALGFAVLSLIVHPATAQGVEWVQQHGTGGSDSTYAIVPDGTGGGFAAGEQGWSVFSQNGADAFLVHYGVTGNVLWERKLGTAMNDRAYAAASDGSSGVFVAGQTSGSLGGPNGGLSDVWFARYDNSGNQLWIRQIAAPQIQVAIGAAPDGTGGFYLTGSTSGPFGGSWSGLADAWIGRFDSAGNRIWLRQFGSSQPDLPHGVARIPSGGVYVCGETYGDLVHASAGDVDAWLARYDGLGNAVWARQFGTTAADTAESIASDGDDGAFVVGTTLGDLGGMAAGITDAWIAHYDGHGDQTWLIQLGTDGVDVATEAVPDGLGGVYATGDSSGDLGGPTLGSNDAWIARYDRVGQQVWFGKFGGPQADLCTTLAMDGAGGFLLGGSTASSLGGPNAGEFDAWTARYEGPCGVLAAYCVASSTSIPDCQAAIGAAGSPSLSDPGTFAILSGSVPGGNLGLCVFGGRGSVSTPYGTLGGQLCVAAPTFRTAPKTSGGDAGQCNGSYAFSLADLIAVAPIVTSSATINAQVWARDPENADGFLLSRGIEFVVCP